MYRVNKPDQGQSYGGGSGSEYSSRELVIENAAPLPFELDAEIKNTGEKVTLLQTCNWPGHSPSFIGVDPNGEPLIAAFHEVRIRDRRAVPNESLTEGMPHKKGNR